MYLAPIKPLGIFILLSFERELFSFLLRSVSALRLWSLSTALICPTMRADFSLKAGKKLSHFDCRIGTVSLLVVSSLQLLMPDLAHHNKQWQYARPRHTENNTMASVCY